MEVKTAELTVYCPLYSKQETVYIRYVINNNELYLALPNGCESSCCGLPQCNACMNNSLEQFKASFQANQ